MKETSKVIMGATLVMVLSLAIVLCLVLVLLAELYCSVLLRRRRLRTVPKGSVTATNSSEPVEAPVSGRQDRPVALASPLSSFIYQGVLDAPRSFLFPKLPSRREQRRREPDDIENQNQCSRFRCFLGMESASPGSNPSPCQPSILSSPSSPYVTVSEPGPSAPALVPEDVAVMAGGVVRGVCSRRGKEELVVYISNPVYDREQSKQMDDTPFETPDTSPSRLETDGSSCEDEAGVMQREKSPCSPEVISTPTPTPTPPLTPIKELPAKACSVSLGNAKASLGSTGSESNSQNGASSSTLGTPCTSPSW